MTTKTEVAADLKVNDLAGATINRIKGAFGALDRKVSSVGHSITSFAKNTASTALGVSMAGFGGTISNLMHEAFAAGEELNKQQKQVAGTLMLRDQSGRGYSEIRAEANGLQEELQNLAIDAGTSSEAVIESFNDIASRSTKSTSEIKDFMGTMAQAARIVPAGLSGITQGFEQIEMGMIRGRNPVVQMITATGLLGGNAQQVARQMMKMTPEKQVKLAEQAIERMAKKMEKVPLTFGESLQAAREMRSQLYEIVGMPIFKGITPMVQELRKQMSAHREEIEAFAAKVGAKATTAFGYATDKVKSAFAYINENWEGIAKSMGTAADTFLAAGKFLVDNRDVIGRAMMMGTGGYVDVMQGKGGHKNMAGIGADVLGGAALGGKAAGPLGAVFGAAAGAVGALSSEVVGLYEDIALELGWINQTVAGLTLENEQREKGLILMRKEAADFEKRFTAQEKYRESAIDLFGLMNLMGKDKVGGEKSEVGFAGLTKQSLQNIDADTQTMAVHMANDFKAMMDYAQQSQDQGAMQAVMNTLANSQRLQYALAASGVDVGKGFDDLIDAMVEGGKMTATAGKQAKELVKGGKDLSTLSKPTISVGGGNTINVKQEFREADPDRIMMSFKAAVTKAAVARINSRVSGPFGGF